MPYPPETRPPGQPSAKPVARELIADLMAYPPCYEDKDVLDWVCRKTGRGGPSSEYPTDYLFGFHQCRGVVGSDVGVPLLLEHDDDLNCAARNAYREITGRRVSRTPPRPDQIAQVARRLAQDEDAVVELLRRFVRVEVAHSRRHGNLLPGAAPDWAHPDPAHTAVGDGTIFLPYSNIAWVLDPVTGGLVPVGSRARDLRRVRVQGTQRLSGADGKREPGINFVTLYTWTSNGCVVLAVGMTLGGESLVVVPMVETLAVEAGDGLHTLVYDRAVQGWILAHLMAQYGIEVVNKAVARALQEGEDSARRRLVRKAQAQAAWQLRKTLSGRALDLAVNHQARAELAAGHLPPGTSIYETSGLCDIIDSAWHRFTEPHKVGRRVIHRERLILDDEALFLEDENGNKGPLCETLHSRRERTSTGTWARRTQWRIPCGDGEWVLEKLWSPADAVSTSVDRLTDRTLTAHMRPVPRASAQFQVTHGRRSTPESKNNEAKDAMPHHGRAAHVHPNLQMIDHFSFGRINNARTWQRHPDAWHPWRPRPSQRAWGPVDHCRPTTA